MRVIVFLHKMSQIRQTQARELTTWVSMAQEVNSHASVELTSGSTFLLKQNLSVNIYYNLHIYKNTGFKSQNQND